MEGNHPNPYSQYYPQDAQNPYSSYYNQGIDPGSSSAPSHYNDYTAYPSHAQQTNQPGYAHMQPAVHEHPQHSSQNHYTDTSAPSQYTNPTSSHQYANPSAVSAAAVAAQAAAQAAQVAQAAQKSAEDRLANLHDQIRRQEEELRQIQDKVVGAKRELVTKLEEVKVIERTRSQEQGKLDRILVEQKQQAQKQGGPALVSGGAQRAPLPALRPGLGAGLGPGAGSGLGPGLTSVPGPVSVPRTSEPPRLEVNDPAVALRICKRAEGTVVAGPKDPHALERYLDFCRQSGIVPDIHVEIRAESNGSATTIFTCHIPVPVDNCQIVWKASAIDKIEHEAKLRAAMIFFAILTELRNAGIGVSGPSAGPSKSQADRFRLPPPSGGSSSSGSNNAAPSNPPPTAQTRPGARGSWESSYPPSRQPSTSAPPLPVPKSDDYNWPVSRNFDHVEHKQGDGGFAADTYNKRHQHQPPGSSYENRRASHAQDLNAQNPLPQSDSRSRKLPDRPSKFEPSNSNAAGPSNSGRPSLGGRPGIGFSTTSDSTSKNSVTSASTRPLPSLQKTPPPRPGKTVGPPPLPPASPKNNLPKASGSGSSSIVVTKKEVVVPATRPPPPTATSKQQLPSLTASKQQPQSQSQPPPPQPQSQPQPRSSPPPQPSLPAKQPPPLPTSLPPALPKQQPLPQSKSQPQLSQPSQPPPQPQMQPHRPAKLPPPRLPQAPKSASSPSALAPRTSTGTLTPPPPPQIKGLPPPSASFSRPPLPPKGLQSPIKNAGFTGQPTLPPPRANAGRAISK